MTLRARIEAALLAEARRLHALIVPRHQGPMQLSAPRWLAERDAQPTRRPNPYLSPPARNGSTSGRVRRVASRARTREQIAKWWRGLAVQIARLLTGRHVR